MDSSDMDSELDKKTVTFINKKKLAVQEVEQIFEACGKVVQYGGTGDRIFVKYNTKVEAEVAMKYLRSVVDLQYATLRKNEITKNRNKNEDSSSNWKSSTDGLSGNSLLSSKPKNKYNSTFERENSKTDSHKQRDQASGRKSFSKSETGTLRSHDSRRASMTNSLQSLEKHLSDSNSSLFNRPLSVRSFRTDGSSLSGSNESLSLPPLIDAKKAPKMYPILLGNLPDDFSLSDVLGLLEEVEPIAITRIGCTSGKQLKYCQVYLSSSKGVDYLKEKLNGFIIRKRKLIAVRPGDLLTEMKWDLPME